jgi:type I restriction enzyme S subunit
MVGEWRECTLGDVIELKRGYDLPQRERRSGNVPIISSSGVTDYHAEAIVKGPGVVTGRYGTLGQVFYVAEDFWPLNTTLYVRDFKSNDPKFISYFLRLVDFLAYSDKAAVPGLNRNHLHLAGVRFPVDVAEQRAIAHILGTLDDKIELNRRMNGRFSSRGLWTLIPFARRLMANPPPPSAAASASPWTCLRSSPIASRSLNLGRFRRGGW